MSAPHPASGPAAARPPRHRREPWTRYGQLNQAWLLRTVPQRAWRAGRPGAGRWDEGRPAPPREPALPLPVHRDPPAAAARSGPQPLDRPQLPMNKRLHARSTTFAG